MEFKHTSVLLQETIEQLHIRPDGIYVDGTLGGGGHSLEICRRLTTGRLIGIDQDECAIAAATERLKDYQDKELPSAREALKEAIKSDGLDESVLDLYDSAVSPDDDLQKVADDLFKKLYPPVEVEPFCDPELDEIVAYFEEK